jgi:hypothetical protein
MGTGAVSDGYLTASNDYDGYMYVFGKGPSATTVSAPLSQITTGQNVTISGTVLDKSPADQGSSTNPTQRLDFQKVVPCVSDNSMAAYMEYQYMQYPIDGIYHNITISGVPVSIDAVDPSGAFVHIAAVTSDGPTGNFGYSWTPTTPGQWKITATFAGDDSYGSSWASTYATVNQAPTATATPTSTAGASNLATTSDLITYVVAVGIAIIIAIAIVGALILRKHA